MLDDLEDSNNPSRRLGSSEGYSSSRDPPYNTP